GDALAQNIHRWINFTLLSFPRNDPKHLENVFHRLEMVAPVPHDMDDTNDAPILEFAQAVADIGAGDSEGLRDLFRRERFFGEKQKGMNLGNGAIDSPARSHFSPMENEFLSDGRKRPHVCQLFLSKQKLEKYTSGVKKIFAL